MSEVGFFFLFVSIKTSDMSHEISFTRSSNKYSPGASIFQTRGARDTMMGKVDVGRLLGVEWLSNLAVYNDFLGNLCKMQKLGLILRI